MITRIVKLTFRENEVASFLNIYEASKDLIKAMNGCLYLSLHNEEENKNVFFTISQWQDESHLNNYRNSDLFKTTWQNTKALFKDKAEAWTINNIHNIGEWQAQS